jgi:predicted nucleic acid-binding protein
MDLLDTDVLVDVQRGHPPAVTWFSALTDMPAVPGFVVMEMIQEAPNAREVRKVLKLVKRLRIVWPSAADCDRALADYATLHPSHGLGLLDALIASCATGLSARLFTFNVKHYGGIRGLVTARPYRR